MFKGLSFDVPDSSRISCPPTEVDIRRSQVLQGLMSFILSAARSYPGSEDDKALLGHESSSGHRAIRQDHQRWPSLVPRGGVRFLIQALSVLITRTNPRISGYRFTVNRHVSYYPTELTLSDDQFVSLRKGYAGATPPLGDICRPASAALSVSLTS